MGSSQGQSRQPALKSPMANNLQEKTSRQCDLKDCKSATNRDATAAHGREYDVSYKVLLVGDSGVGKTALIKSLMGQSFNPNLGPTIGIDFVKQTFDIDGARVQLEIWDTAGQERFRTITRFQYRGTKGLLLLYDVTSKSSFEMLDYWLDSIDKEIDLYQKEPVPVFILGNKCDLDAARAVTERQGRKLAEATYVHGFLESSAKESINVREAFKGLAEAITEVNHPKIMNAYLTPDERDMKEQRRMGEMLVLEAQQHKQKPSRAVIKLNRLVEKADRCSC